MDVVASVDRLISRLEAFKAAVPNAQIGMTGGDFAQSFSDATVRLEQVLAQGASTTAVADDVQVATAEADEPTFAAFQAQNLLVDTEAQSIAARPNMREFMDATGVDAAHASELLYGVIGSNADLRDWSKIMASGNPVDAARAATGQMYNSDKEYALVKHQDYGQLTFADTLAESSLSSKTVVQQQGNFATIEVDDGSQQTMAVSSTGLILRGAGSTQAQIERTAWLFGFDSSALFGRA
jgi:hypothetical protein